MTRRGLVLGCGGTLGFTWSVAALHALRRELDWDPAGAEVVIGTSGGAELAAILAAGFSLEEVLAARTGSDSAPALLLEHFAAAPSGVPPLPGPGLAAPGLVRARAKGRVDTTAAAAGLLPLGTGDNSWLVRLGEALAPSVRHPNLMLVAADRRTGKRVPLREPLGLAIAASWAIPGWFPPVTVGGREYIDGGVVSPTSADLLVPFDLDEVVVVAPMTSPRPVPARGLSRVERVLRRPMSARFNREVRVLEGTGVLVRRYEPTAEALAVMGPNFMDRRRVLATLEVALRTTVGEDA
ncbi:patatin-like phospholipase family protein [Actinokineospora pegani]|uniref:patatin-like phospholipase family protein n=1 Tax=Actinokineospora pegani TaxID=2654637 RepID=UPI0012EA8631|nr:patatin-like phospholipase family protein [Actinokineospora pegani]